MDDRAQEPGAPGLDADLAAVLEASESLPRPPGVAFRLIQRTQDEDATAEDVAAVLASDPVLAAKVVGAANSPLYAQRGEVTSLERAVTVLGFKTTRSTGVSFSLLSSLKAGGKSSDIDYALFWRSSLLSAVAGGAVGVSQGLRSTDELFLSCLLQDIGILALAAAVPHLYEGLTEGHLDQDALIARERERFGADHSVVGGWLVEKKWGFPEEIVAGVLGSHGTWHPSAGDLATSVASVALSSRLARALLHPPGSRDYEGLRTAAYDLLGVTPTGLLEILRQVCGMIPESERVFETKILSPSDADAAVAAAEQAFSMSDVPA